MNSMSKILRILLFLLTTTLAACHANVYNEYKYVADPESCIPLLKGGPHSGSIKTKDIFLEYQYTRNSDLVSFVGFVELDFSLTGNYDILLFFDLMVCPGAPLITGGGSSGEGSMVNVLGFVAAITWPFELSD